MLNALNRLLVTIRDTFIYRQKAAPLSLHLYQVDLRNGVSPATFLSNEHARSVTTVRSNFNGQIEKPLPLGDVFNRRIQYPFRSSVNLNLQRENENLL